MIPPRLHRQCFRLATCLLLSLLLAAPPAPAQTFFLPLEAGDGVLLPDRGTKPFLASARLHPTLGFGQRNALRIGLTGAVAYVNPEVSVQGGGRLWLRVHEVTALGRFPVAEVALAAEALWGTKQRNPVGGALIFGVGRLAQFTLRGGYDLEQEAPYLGVALGTDLSFLLGTRPPPPSQNDLSPRFIGYQNALYVNARQRASASLFENADALIQAIQQLDRAALLRQPTLDTAKRFLEAQGLGTLATQIDDVLENAEQNARGEGLAIPTDQPLPWLLDTFHEAWIVAVELAEN